MLRCQCRVASLEFNQRRPVEYIGQPLLGIDDTQGGQLLVKRLGIVMPGVLAEGFESTRTGAFAALAQLVANALQWLAA